VPGLTTYTRERAGTVACPLAGSLSCLRVVHESASKCMLARLQALSWWGQFECQGCQSGQELVWREDGGLSGCRAALRECAVVVSSLYVWLLELSMGGIDWGRRLAFAPGVMVNSCHAIGGARLYQSDLKLFVQGSLSVLLATGLDPALHRPQLCCNFQSSKLHRTPAAALSSTKQTTVSKHQHHLPITTSQIGISFHHTWAHTVLIAMHSRCVLSAGGRCLCVTRAAACVECQQEFVALTQLFIAVGHTHPHFPQISIPYHVSLCCMAQGLQFYSLSTLAKQSSAWRLSFEYSHPVLLGRSATDSQSLSQTPEALLLQCANPHL
jgi:hypothetical protein